MLLGGIGSGKSTVGRLLAERGWLVVDADLIGRRVLEPGGEALAAVAVRWPAVVVGGEIDRKGLAAIVFSNRDELAELEAITHPAIRRRLLDLVAATDGPVAVQAPVLADLLPGAWVRVVVDAPDDVRRERLRLRGMDPADIDRRMASQPPREGWIAAGDYLLDNGGDEEDLVHQVEVLLNDLESRARPG